MSDWWNRKGVTREVFLIGGYAIKLPKLTEGWKMFLQGLLANMQEAQFSAAGWPELCPVVFSIRGGWLLVMNRAAPLTDAEWRGFNPDAFVQLEAGYSVPVEIKRDSFGSFRGRIVAVDYGT